jgi:type IV fimbrial biogenesis protein FimT
MKQRGLTLWEVLIGLILLGIVAAMAAPSLSAFVDAQRRQDTAQQLTSSLRMARAEAILRNQHVVVQAKEGNWSKGWSVFVDANRNQLPDEDDIVLTEFGGYRNMKVIGNSKVRTKVGFDRTGRLLDNANGTLAVCRDDSPASHYQVVIAVTGRIILRDDGFASEPCA